MIFGIGGCCAQLLQICSDYKSLPNPKKMTIPEIRFFYNPQIKDLIETQKQIKNAGKK